MYVYGAHVFATMLYAFSDLLLFNSLTAMHQFH